MQWSKNWRVSHGRWLSKQGGALWNSSPVKAQSSRWGPAFKKSYKGWLLDLEKMNQSEKRVQPGEWFRDRNATIRRKKTWQPNKKTRRNQSSRCMFLNHFPHAPLWKFEKELNILTNTKSEQQWFQNLTFPYHTNHPLPLKLRITQLGGSNCQQGKSNYQWII